MKEARKNEGREQKEIPLAGGESDCTRKRVVNRG